MKKLLTEPQKEWVKALRSKEFTQGRHTLHRMHNNKSYYCCLGVACEIFNRRFPGELIIEKFEDFSTYNKESGILPKKVKDWLGLRQAQGNFWLKYEFTSLTNLNDSKNLSFEEIADIIESNSEELFI